MADMPSAASATPSAAPAATPAATIPGKPDNSKAPAIPESAGKAAPVAEESYDVVIDGKPHKKTRKELIEAFQLRELSDRKRGEAEKTMAEYTKIFNVLKQDPVKFLKATGVDFETLATQFLSKKAEEAMMDPKDRELRDAKAKAEQYEKWAAEQKAAKEKETKDGEVSVARQQIHKEIIDAIQESAATLGLPVDEELVIQVAQQMLLQDKKQKPLNAKEALPKAYESSQKYLRGIASKMEGEALIKWLGPEVATKIRKHDLQMLKAKRQTPVAQARVEAPKAEAAQPKYKTWSQFKAEKLDTIK